MKKGLVHENCEEGSDLEIEIMIVKTCLMARLLQFNIVNGNYVDILGQT